jgi:tetratricopeptide (TPR) repeat protein
MKATLLLHQQGQGAKAAEAFGEAWNKGARGPEVARLYSDTLMSQPKPDLDRILVVLAAPQNQIDSWSPLLTMRARVYRLQGRVADSDADIQAAFKVLNQQNASAVASFFQDMSEMYSGRTGEMLAAIEALKPPEGFSEAFRIQVIRFKLMQKDLQEAALRDLDEMVANAPNKQAVQIALRQMGDLMFVERNYEMAAELYRRVLQVNPADFDTMNNLAYTLSKFLQKHDQAEPYAHKAAEASPANPNILDTYGSVLLALGRVPESEAMFQRALAGANRADQQVPLWIHMAQVSLAKGERPGAVDYLQKADREIGRSPELRGRFGPEYDEVKRKVDGGR